MQLPQCIRETVLSIKFWLNTDLNETHTNDCVSNDCRDCIKVRIYVLLLFIPVIASPQVKPNKDQPQYLLSVLGQTDVSEGRCL